MESTKEKIMWAAAEVFAEHGFADTTNRMIAAKAGVNHALINYHFQGKRELYKRVVGYLIDKHAPSEVFSPRVTNDKEWRMALTEINKRFLFEVLDTDPLQTWKEAIFNREMNNPTDVFREIFEEYMKPRFNQYINLVQMGVPRKTSEKETMIIVFTLLGQLIFFKKNRAFVEMAYQGEIYTEKTLNRIAEYITETVCRTLKFRKPQTKKN
jgi:AcrR family transcriptional regulator